MISWRNPDARHARLGTWTPTCTAVLRRAGRRRADHRHRPHRADRRLLRRHHRQPGRRLPGRDRPAGPAGRVHPAGHRARQRAGRHVGGAGRRADSPPPRRRCPRRRGYLDGRALAEVFAWLRPGDLIWNYWVNNYLLGKQAAGVRHPVLERRHHPDDRPAARRLRRHRDGQRSWSTAGARHRARRARSTCPGSTSTPTSSPASPTTSRRGRTATAAPSCSAATPGSCCPPAATSPRWSTRRATPRPSYQVNKDNPADPQQWLQPAQHRSRAPGGPTSRPGWASAAAPTRRAPDQLGGGGLRAARRGPRHLRLREAEERP